MLPADHAVEGHGRVCEHRRLAAQSKRRNPVARVLRAANELGRAGRLGEARGMKIDLGDPDERLDRRGRHQRRRDGDPPAGLAEDLGRGAPIARSGRLVEAGERDRAIEAVVIGGEEGAPPCSCSASTLAPP